MSELSDRTWHETLEEVRKHPERLWLVDFGGGELDVLNEVDNPQELGAAMLELVQTGLALNETGN